MQAQAMTESFRSVRTADAHQEDMADQDLAGTQIDDAVPADADFAEPVPVTTTVLMVSTSPVVLEHFERTAMKSPETRVTSYCTTLLKLLDAQGVDAFAYDIVVFETTRGDTEQLQALRIIAGARAGKSRFMALTDQELSLTDAKALIDAGVDEVLPLSSILPGVKAPAALEPEPAVAGENGYVIVVAKARGGVGATTLAVNLANALQTNPKATKGAVQNRVALVDFDIQNGAVGAFLDIEETGAFIDLLRNGEVPENNFLRRAMIAHESGVAVLPAPTDMAPVDALTGPMISGLMGQLKSRYDYIVVDLPVTILPSIAALLAKTNKVLLVTDTAVTSIRQASRLLNFLTEDNFALPVEIVVSQEAKPFRLPPSLKEAQNVLRHPFNHWIPRDDKTARRAIDCGKPIMSVAGRAPVTKAYRALADGVMAAQTLTAHNAE